jgi:HPt (histidine-containing phosphotransfer) domain-containing protein
VAKAAHTIKGAAANLGFAALSSQAHHLEQSAKANHSGLEDMFDRLRHLADATEARWLKTHV